MSIRGASARGILGSVVVVARHAVLAALSVATVASAQVTPVASAWRAIADADATAALRLVEENHPGAAPELGDAAFQALLTTARAHLAERLPKVADFGGYNAVMNGLAADFRDGHIYSSATVGFAIRRWAGIMPMRRGGAWIVGVQRAADGEPDPAGAQILSCDGVAFDAFANEQIGLFGGDPGLEAVLIVRAASLLTDDANPFVRTPTACTFRKDGKDVTISLTWRRILQTDWRTLSLQTQNRSDAGIGVSDFAGGKWIAIDTLEDRKPVKDLIATVEAQGASLRAAPMVVIDLRGNGGGNSANAVAIANVLEGRIRVAAAGSIAAKCQGDFWRVSPFNLAAIRESRDQYRASGDADTANYFDDIDRDMTKALAEGRAFSPALPACARANTTDATRPRPLPPSPMKGRLIVLTDHSCFSSCLIAVDLFRKLGALHVGEATDVSTRFMEVRETALPSGMRSFSVLRKVEIGAGNFGPYVPARPFAGDVSDDAAVKKWVAGL